MPLAIIKVIESVFSDEEKQRMVEKVSEAIISVDGEGLRDKTVVLLEEVKNGDWAFGGKKVTADFVKQVRASHKRRAIC
jgi:4-oxalocrotonate tautomerase